MHPLDSILCLIKNECNQIDICNGLITWERVREGVKTYPQAWCRLLGEDTPQNVYTDWLSSQGNFS